MPRTPRPAKRFHHAPVDAFRAGSPARGPALGSAARPRAAGHRSRSVADLRHLRRRMAQLRRGYRRQEVLAAGSDRRGQLLRSGAGLGVDVGRPPRQQDHAGGRRVVGAARRRGRGARRGDPQPLPDRPPAEPDRVPGHAADGRRRPLLQHAAVAGRRRRRRDRRDAVGLQPQELRRGHDDDDRDVAPAGRRLLDRRRRRRAHLLGHRQRLSGVRRREDRAALRRLRSERQRHGRRHERRPARQPRRARLPERPALRDPLAADRRPRQGDPRLARRRPPDHQGGDPGLGPGLGRAHRRARLGLPHRAQQRRRVRGRHLAEPVLALLGQRQRLVDAGRRQRARATSTCRPERPRTTTTGPTGSATTSSPKR